MDLYLFLADQQTGPYTDAEARALVASSQITRSCLAWHEGMEEWLPLEEVVALPKPPSPPVTKVLPPVPPRSKAQPPRATTVASVPAASSSSSSTIRTVSGVIALLLGLLAIFNIGGCMNAQSKLASFRRGDNAMDGMEMLVDTARGANEGDPLRGVAGLMDKAHSLQDDYESSQLGAWLCLVGTAVAGGLCIWSRPQKTNE